MILFLILSYPPLARILATPFSRLAAPHSAAEMAAGDSLPALLAFTLVEAYLLQRTIFADETFRTVVLGTVSFNVFLKSLYSLVIWPFFLNPLRHLPMVPVRTIR